VYFLIGLICYRYRYRIRIPGYLVLLLPVAFLVSEWGHFSDLASFVIIPASVLFCAVNGTTLVHEITPSADFSYGLYLWSFPTQQIVVNYIYSDKAGLIFLLTLGLTFIPAALSWYLVENRALQAKEKRPQLRPLQ